MNYLVISLLALCLVMAASCAVCLAVHVHRQRRWKKATYDYMDATVKQMEAPMAELTDRFGGLCANMESIDGQMGELEKRVAYILKRLEKVDDGITGLNMDMEKVGRYKADIDAIRAEVEGLRLDYREAQNAASQINDYAGHLASIFSYDPLEERRKNRKESGEG